MSFWGHLDVLRGTLLRSVIAVAVCFVGCFAAMPYIFEPVILSAARRFGVEIININVMTPFLTHMSTSLWAGLIVAFPYLIWELWRFIAPALYPQEKKSVGGAMAGVSLLFYAGCAVGYFCVFPLTFKFLAGYQIGEGIESTIALNSYISIFLSIIFVMGLVFEMPVLAWVLGKLGIIDRKLLKSGRRIAIVALLIIAAVITPTGDPFTLMVVFVPLYLLYEISILVIPNGKH